MISEEQYNFCIELCDSVEAQRNSAIAEQDFCNKLKRNLTSAIQISKYHNANNTFFAILNIKKVNNLLRRPTFINIMIEMEQN